MTTFLFWNLNRGPIQALVSELAQIHQVDVLILAECDIQPPVLLNALNQNQGSMFHLTDSECEKIVIYTRFSRGFIKKEYETNRLTTRRLMLPGSEEILLTAVHAPSKRDWKDRSQDFECVDLAETIRGVEQKVGHRRTVLVGDFNMSPFEDGIVAAKGLNAVMSRNVANRKSRRVLEKNYNFFYNPMWSHFGDATDGPPGTFYRGGSEQVEYFWHMFDQVLIRPELLSIFRNEELKILTGVSGTSFLTGNGLPNRSVASDHLPILFRLEM